MSIIVQSIDVGYGNVKTAKSTSDNSIICDTFPSWAVPAKNNHIAGGIVSRRNTICVDVQSMHYEVGPDIERALEENTTKPLHSSYVNSYEYEALCKGALYYAGESHINLLVTGLPVNYLNSKSHYVSSLLTGEHVINGRSISVKRVEVIAQPLGGFIDFALSNGLYATYRDQTILVIDVGYYTTDWITTTGLHVHDSRSGSHAGGMNMILKAISESLSAEQNVVFSQLNKLDHGLRSGRFHINGRKIDLSLHIANAHPYIERTIHSIHESLGNSNDIERIILLGGGSPHFRDVLNVHFPNLQIHTLANPIFSNVRGFQRIGQQIMRSI